MKIQTTILILSVGLLSLLSCNKPAADSGLQPESYVPESKELYDSIVAMDAAWEDAYNNCKVDVMDSIISDNIEFYHDQGGVTTSKQAIMEAVEKNICGKVTRELLKGSIEVYGIHGYGAVQMGRHAFHNHQEPAGGKSHFSKFVHIWHRENKRWRITRVISLH